MKNRNTIFATILLPLGFLALFPIAYGVVPAPDGGYPGSNTAEGQNALFSRTTGVWNTALGALSLYSDTTGNGNTAVGINTLRHNINGAFNTSVGLNALFFNNGDPANGEASQNAAFGTSALFNNTTGSENCAFGPNALFHNNTGSSNCAFGSGALYLNTNGVYNTAIGGSALFSNTGSDNTAVGHGALSSNSDGFQNTATGINALANNSGGNFNTAIGAGALLANNTGSTNTAVGDGALGTNTSGGTNTALGFGAGSNITTANNVICIGIAGQNVSDSFYVANVFETSIDPDNLPVRIDFTGRLGTQSSSQRFKDDIKPMDKASQAILGLQPVTFHYKNDTKRSRQFGLIAEEVAKVDPNLVALDKEGKPYTVRYDQVNAMLLNEFLKEHRKVESQGSELENQRKRIREQEATIAGLKCMLAKQEKATEALAAHARDQDSKIKQVSAQIEMSKPVSKVVADRPDRWDRTQIENKGM
jgi:hypothetical protein